VSARFPGAPGQATQTMNDFRMALKSFLSLTLLVISCPAVAAVPATVDYQVREMALDEAVSAPVEEWNTHLLVEAPAEMVNGVPGGLLEPASFVEMAVTNISNEIILIDEEAGLHYP
jgi:hypothetical protein